MSLLSRLKRPEAGADFSIVVKTVVLVHYIFKSGIMGLGKVFVAFRDQYGIIFEKRLSEMRNKLLKGLVGVGVTGFVFLFLSAGLLAAEPAGYTADDFQIPLDSFESKEISYPGGSFNWDFDFPDAALGWKNEYNLGDIEWDFDHTEGIIRWTDGCHEGQFGWDYDWPCDWDCDKPDDNNGQPGNDVPGGTGQTPGSTAEKLPQTGGFGLLAGAVGTIVLGTGLVAFRRR